RRRRGFVVGRRCDAPAPGVNRAAASAWDHGRMLSEKLLLDDETGEAETRTHVKVLLVPFLIALAIMLVGGYFVGAIGASGGGTPRLIGLVVLLVLFVWGSLLPFLRW